MIDARPYFRAQEAAYALEESTDRAKAMAPGTVLDIVHGSDLDGARPYGIVMTAEEGPILAFRGTINLPQLLEDMDILPRGTPAGECSAGIGSTFNSLTLESGRPLQTFANVRVCGHSRGADLAAAWASQFQTPEWCLFAYPRLCGRQILHRLGQMPGNAFVVRGDPVAGLITGWPSAPNEVQLRAQGASLDPLWYHHLVTYEAAILALQGLPGTPLRGFRTTPKVAPDGIDSPVTHLHFQPGQTTTVGSDNQLQQGRSE